MIQALKKPVKPLWYVCALFIVVCSVLIQAARLSIPFISAYKSALEAIASQQLQAQVSFSHIAGSWYGLRPQIVLSNVSLESNDGAPIFSIKHAKLELNIVASVLFWVPVWQKVEIEGLKVKVQQSPAGGWSVGTTASTGATTNQHWQYRSPSALFLIAKHVDIQAADIQFGFHNKRQLTTSIPHISIRNRGRFHRLNAQLAFEDEKLMDFVLEGVGNPSNPERFFARAYLQLERFPLERIATLFSQVAELPENFIDAGFSLAPAPSEAPPAVDGSQADDRGSTVDLKLWFDFASPSRFFMNGHVDLAVVKPSEFAKENFLDIPFRADINGDYSIKTGLTLGLQNAKLDEQVAIASTVFNLHDDELSISMAESDVSIVSDWAVKRVIQNKKIRSVIQTISPSGHLKNIQATIDLKDIKASTIRLDISDGELQAWNNVPGFKAINGLVTANLEEGTLLLDTQDFHMFPARLYEKPLGMRDAQGLIGWQLQPKKNRVSIYGKELLVKDDFGEANGYFDLLIPWQPGSYKSEFMLQFGLKNSDAAYYPGFIPNRFPQSLKQWMSDAIVAGTIDEAGFIYRGGFNDTSNRSIQFYANIDGGTLKNESWPTLYDIDGIFVVDNTKMDARIDKARFFQDTVSGRVSWNQSQQNLLRIMADGESDIESGLDFIRQSWLSTKTKGLFDRWTGAGQLNLKANLALPLLDDEKEPKINVSVGLDAEKIQLTEQDLTFFDVQGDFVYSSQEGFGSRDLQADLFGEKIAMEFSGGNKEQENLQLAANGRVSIKALSQWSDQPLANIAKGAFNYQVAIDIPPDELGATAPTIRLASDLYGVSLSLPEPFTKLAESKKDAHLLLSISDQGNVYTINYDDRLKAKIVDNSPAASLDQQVPMSIQVLFSDQALNTPYKEDQPGVNIFGQFSQLNLSPWLDQLELISTFNVTQDPQAPALPIRYVINMNAARYDSIDLQALEINGRRQESSWLTELDSNVLNGSVQVPEANEPLTIDLEYLNLTKSNATSSGEDSESDPLADIELTTIQPANIRINNLSYEDKQFGKWSFRLRKDNQGLELRHLKAQIGELVLQGKNQDQGAYLRWQMPGEFNEMYTRFVGKVHGKNIKSLFESLQTEPPLESKATSLAVELDWQGSPANISMDNVTGSIDFEFKDGLFVQNEESGATGFLKIIGLMNFDTWARRIRLDFSDLYKKGLVFDNLSGKVGVDQGVISTKTPVVATGPSSKLSLIGQVDHDSQALEGELVATLPIGGNLTVAAALAAGLPAAAGVYLISKLFKKQVDQVSSIKYNISGTLEQPELEVNQTNQDDQDSLDADGIDTLSQQ